MVGGLSHMSGLWLRNIAEPPLGGFWEGFTPAALPDADDDGGVLRTVALGDRDWRPAEVEVQ